MTSEEDVERDWMEWIQELDRRARFYQRLAILAAVLATLGVILAVLGY